MKLNELSVKDFVFALASKTPTPGGGSAAAASGAMGIGLLLMAGTFAEDPALAETLGSLESLQIEMLDLIDLDAASFDGYMEAMKLPKETEEEKAHRREQMQLALKEASQIPFKTLKSCHAVLKSLPLLTSTCKKSMISDLGSASSLLRTAVEGAFLNVLINASSIKDESFVKEMMQKATTMKNECLDAFGKTLEGVEEKLAIG